MSFEPKLRAYTAPVFTVEVGSGERKMTPGGATEIMEIIGKEETVERIKAAIEKLQA